VAGQPAADPEPDGGRDSGRENGREGRRADVLRLLKAAEAPLSIADIARQLDVHPNTVRFHLDPLVSSGLAERVPPQHGRSGRPPLLFRAVRRMDPSGQRRYQMLAEILVQGLAAGPDPAQRAAEAGRAWGRQLAPMTGSDAKNRDKDGAETGPARTGEPAGRLVSLLDELGFAPDLRVTDEGVQIGLRHCPFLELAESRAQVVCPVHLGLMRGAMDAWDAPVTVDRLEAFAQPDLCVAHLAVAETTA
jgi:predicted ArsR family transcriptional regulator